MANKIELEELQGHYDIVYASTPQLDQFYEPGFGSAKIEGNKLTGVDALGVIWNAEYQILQNGTISYEALLNPSDAPSTVGLIDDDGILSREPQIYNGILNVTKTDRHLILRTTVKQGPITIDVQFRKK